MFILYFYLFLFKTQPTMVSGIRPGMMSGPSSGAGGPFAMGAMTQPGMPMGSSIRPAANQQLDPFGAL